MWDDIIIGNGPKGCSAILVFEIEGNTDISQDGVSFWISRCFLDVGMKIFKDTVEGKRLQQMIDEKAPLARINEWLDKIVLTRLSPAEARKRILREKQKSFEEGQRAKAAELAKALYLTR